MIDGTFHLTTVRARGVDYARLVDAKVRIRGVAALLFTKSRQIVGARLFFPGMEQVTVEEAAPEDPFATPPRPIDSLLRFTPDARILRRAHIQGRVTLHWPADALRAG